MSRCFSAIDMGTVVDYSGKKDDDRRVRLGFEVFCQDPFSGEFMAPLVVWKEYRNCNAPNSMLMGDVCRWQNKGFTEEEAAGFSVFSLISKPCLVELTFKLSKAQRPYASVSSIRPLPTGMECPAQFRPSSGFSAVESSHVDDYRLPEFLKDWLSRAVGLENLLSGQALLDWEEPEH